MVVSEYPGNVAKILAKLIDKCTEEVLIVSGSLPSSTYDHPDFTKAMKGALNKEVNFKVIIGSDYDRQNSFFLNELEESIFIAPSRPKIHFTVGDRKHVRYEGAHEKGIEEPNNHVEYDYPETGEYLVNIFSEAIKSCTPFKDKATI